MSLGTFRQDKGYTLPFQITTPDKRALNLSGMTVILEAKSPAGTIATVTGTVTGASSGYCEFTIPASFFATSEVWNYQVHITNGSSYIQHTTIETINVNDTVGST